MSCVLVLVVVVIVSCSLWFVVGVGCRGLRVCVGVCWYVFVGCLLCLVCYWLDVVYCLRCFNRLYVIVVVRCVLAVVVVYCCAVFVVGVAFGVV